MLQYIYTRPIANIITLMIVLILAWGWLCTYVYPKQWRHINCLFLLPVLVAISYATLSNRESGTYPLILNPLAKLETALIQPELYREMLMNTLLFLPLGLTLSHALSDRLPRWGRFLLTVICGCLLSTGIEYIQYQFSLGMAETADVICNTLGAALGAASLLLAHILEHHIIERRRQRL